jgi:gluconolactonase
MRSLIAFAVMTAAAGLAGCSVTPVEVVEVPSYCEGICFDRNGHAFISYGAYVAKIDVASGKFINQHWLRGVGAPNGHKVLTDGTHLICDGHMGRVVRVADNGNIGAFIEDVARSCDGRRLRAPNDLTVDAANRGFYFTDPGGSSLEKKIGTVHYVDASGRVSKVAEGLAFPNGIVLTPDGARLYVAESQMNRVLVYDVQGPGKLGEMKVFCELPSALFGGVLDNQPDGMCLDEAGNLYVAHYGMRAVQVVDPSGKVIKTYNGGNLTTSNVAFGGPDHNQLFVTGAIEDEAKSKGKLFRLNIGVKGLELLPPK